MRRAATSSRRQAKATEAIALRQPWGEDIPRLPSPGERARKVFNLTTFHYRAVPHHKETPLEGLEGVFFRFFFDDASQAGARTPYAALRAPSPGKCRVRSLRDLRDVRDRRTSQAIPVRRKALRTRCTRPTRRTARELVGWHFDACPRFGPVFRGSKFSQPIIIQGSFSFSRNSQHCLCRGPIPPGYPTTPCRKDPWVAVSSGLGLRALPGIEQCGQNAHIARHPTGTGCQPARTRRHRSTGSSGPKMGPLFGSVAGRDGDSRLPGHDGIESDQNDHSVQQLIKKMVTIIQGES